MQAPHVILRDYFKGYFGSIRYFGSVKYFGSVRYFGGVRYFGSVRYFGIVRYFRGHSSDCTKLHQIFIACAGHRGSHVQGSGTRRKVFFCVVQTSPAVWRMF